MRALKSLLILILGISVLGCARWEEPETRSRPIFPQSKIAIDAVGLELGIAQLDSHQSDSFEQFWKLLDSQALPLELRKRLDQNGIRAAVMSSNPPSLLHTLVEDQPIVESELNEFEKLLHAKRLLRPKQRMIAHERISNREGQAHPITISETHSQVSWVIQNGDRQTIGAGDFVRGVIAVKTFPQGDGSVRIIFSPEIHHGKPRRQIGVAERSFLHREGQTVTPVKDLEFEVKLRPGESIAVAPTADIDDVGKLFFGSYASDENQKVKGRPVSTHRVLLIRVVQTQMDDLFSDANTAEKLTSTMQN
jgi:hypothetical protein